MNRPLTLQTVTPRAQFAVKTNSPPGNHVFITDKTARECHQIMNNDAISQPEETMYKREALSQLSESGGGIGRRRKLNSEIGFIIDAWGW